MKCLYVLMLFCVVSCVTQKEKDTKLVKAWTPELTNAFIEDAKNSGCFTKKIVVKNNQEYSCYDASIQYVNKEWQTECEPMCQKEVPECYEDGWVPPLSDRCKKVDAYNK